MQFCCIGVFRFFRYIKNTNNKIRGIKNEFEEVIKKTLLMSMMTTILLLNVSANDNADETTLLVKDALNFKKY